MLLNVSFGIFAFLPQGWLFMLAVILLESMVITASLFTGWFNKKIYKAVALSNIISGVAGIVISMILNGGWWIVVWFPWISKHEINLKNDHALGGLVLFYLAAFVVTLALEIRLNKIFLRKEYPAKKIIRATVIANIVSYAIGTMALYSYSFN